MSYETDAISTSNKVKEDKPKQREGEEHNSSKSKRKNKAKIAIEDGHEESASSGMPVSKKEEKKRKRHGLDDETTKTDLYITEETGVTNERTRKRSKSRSVSATGNEPAEESNELTRKKAKKRSQKHEENTLVEHSNLEKKKVKDKGSKRKSKKAHKKDEAASDASLPSPDEDTTLTDKARGALSYARTRFSSPESWKFNKARQNWIAKHFFSASDIPTKYVPFVVDYLASCRGGVRQNLIEACNKHHEPSASDQESPTRSSTIPTETTVRPVGEANNSTTAAFLPDPGSDGSSPKIPEDIEQRARALLKALETTAS